MGDIMEIKDFNFDEEVLQAEETVLVDFYAPWCGPCRMISPILEEFAQEYAGKLKIVKVNVDENSLTATNFKVLSIPTLIFFQEGEAKETIVGFTDKEELRGKIEEMIG
ncbi:MAG: thioredoxin [Candidatus Syntrophonatronum acetioxidans]|uniref:Thioredoxin n=1 Tax=Candidatus Syntrophonatronum acetioxidans TaxID=1795816 RepID=A0A424YDB6_9FIRM|nr:MAG: thioredoxin [Candidatus Syntrophonatronum acetioxidans]